MSTNREFFDRARNWIDEGRVNFIHSPNIWSRCRLPVNLEWSSVPFTEDNRNMIPADKFGIYAFMLIPNVIGPPKSGYLLYIGKTEEFKRRYREYLSEMRSPNFFRPRISHMLRKWNGHIWFHYAPIDDTALIDEIESTLINTCIPPGNTQFRGRLGRAITAFR